MIPLMYPLITGKGSGPMKKIFEKKMNDGKDSSDYIQKFMRCVNMIIRKFLQNWNIRNLMMCWTAAAEPDR